MIRVKDSDGYIYSYPEAVGHSIDPRDNIVLLSESNTPVALFAHNHWVAIDYEVTPERVGLNVEHVRRS